MSMVGVQAFAHDIAVMNADGVTIYYNYINNKSELAVGIPESGWYTGNVTIPESVIYNGETYKVTSIGDYAFDSCTGLTSITIPSSVTSIDYKAFSNCTGLTSITIPSSVTTIGYDAFTDCTGLTSITIPSSVTTIGKGVLIGCSGLASIKVDAGNTVYDSRDNCNAIIETATNTLVAGCKNTTIPSSVTSIDHSAFFGCTGLTSITIPEGVTSIGSQAFEACSGLTSVTIPSSVTSIGDWAFDGCTGTVKINSNAIVSKSYSSSFSLIYIFGKQISTYILGENITSIGDYAFSGCTGLTSVTIPSNVNTIGENAFYGCDNLKFVYSLTEYPAFVKIGDGAFPVSQSNYSRATLYVKKGLKEVYSQADGWKLFIDIREMTDEQYNELLKETDGNGKQEDKQEGTVVNLTVTLSSAGYATFFNASNNFKLPAGLSALVITSESGQALIYKTIASGDAGGIIPKGVPVILVSNSRTGGTYTLTSTTEGASYTGSNLLHGSSVQTMTSNANGVSTTGNSNYVYYKLSYGKSGSTNANKLGWYWGASNGAPFTIEGGKAWLALPKSSAQSLDCILFTDDDATAVDGIGQGDARPAEGVPYNMAGQRVGNGYKGMVIMNGKKVIK